MSKRSSAVIGCLLIALMSLGADQRTYTAGHFSITIDGVTQGFVTSIEGGGIHADVAADAQGKHLGNVRYEDIVIQVSPDSQEVRQLVSGAWQGNAPAHNGSIYIDDFDYNVQTEVQFTGARVSEV